MLPSRCPDADAGLSDDSRSGGTFGTEFTLQIAPVTVELAPNRIVSTIGYNGISPGPRLRMKEGVPVTVNVVNDTDVPEYVHFHGLLDSLRCGWIGGRRYPRGAGPGEAGQYASAGHRSLNASVGHCDVPW